MTKRRNYYRTASLLSAQTRTRHLSTPRRPIRIPWPAVVVIAAVVAVSLWVWLGNAWYVMPDDIRVRGISTPALAQTVLETADMHGWHLFRLKPAEIEPEVMAACPQLRDLTIDCGIFPAHCDIEADERVPVLAWVSGASIYWVDEEGEVFPAEEGPNRLPVVNGPLPASDDPAALVPVVEGVRGLMALDLPVDNLEYTPQRGLILMDESGRRLAFGVGSDMRSRWETYQVLSSHLEARGVAPRVIDVRFPDGVTYAMERSW